MKNPITKQILITASSFFLLALLAVSCNKRDDLATQEGVREVVDGEAVELKLQQFQSQLDFYRSYPDVKSGELMSLEEAIWNLETFFNVSYSHAEENYTTYQVDTLSFSLSLTSGGSVEASAVVSLYDEMVQTIAKLYYDNPLQDKNYFILNIVLGPITSGSAELVLYSIIGQNRGIDPGDPGLVLLNPFEGQYWKYGDLLGTCSGSQMGTDAAIQLCNKLNAFNEPRKNYPPVSIGGYVFVDLETIWVEGKSYQNQNGNYLMFYLEKNGLVPFTDDEKCLDPDELHFHYLGLKQVVYNRIPAAYGFAPNRMLVSANMEGIKKDADNFNNHCLTHNGEFLYGTRVNIINIPKDKDLPVPLD